MYIIHCRKAHIITSKDKAVPRALKLNFIATLNLDFQEEKGGIELRYDEVKIRIKKY